MFSLFNTFQKMQNRVITETVKERDLIQGRDTKAFVNIEEEAEGKTIKKGAMQVSSPLG